MRGMTSSVYGWIANRDSVRSALRKAGYQLVPVRGARKRRPEPSAEEREAAEDALSAELREIASRVGDPAKLRKAVRDAFRRMFLRKGPSRAPQPTETTGLRGPPWTLTPHGEALRRIVDELDRKRRGDGE